MLKDYVLGEHLLLVGNQVTSYIGCLFLCDVHDFILFRGLGKTRL